MKNLVHGWVNVLFLALSASAQAGDLTAGNCEVFVDRVGAASGSHGYRQLTLFVKTLNERLDGPIAKVGLFALLHDDGGFASRICRGNDGSYSSNDCDKLGKWLDYPLTQFPNSQDYWTIRLDIGHDYTFRHRYEGAVYVETVKGTRYWSNPANGGNFFLDANMKENIDRIVGRYSYSSTAETALNTASSFPYLNPAGCR